jgi:spoIIIJ-associated protein
MKIYTFEGKTEEQVIFDALKELNVKEDEMIKEIKEEEKGLLKKKKYNLNVVLKSDIINYSKELIKEITHLMGIEVNMETIRKTDQINIILHSENNNLLIGKNGKTLKALQYILKQSLLNKTNMTININVDVENYKENRKKHIERLAKKLAKEVLKTNEEIKMTSMNSYERRLVHEVLKNFKNIKTESEGEEPNRSVVIKKID